MYGIAFKPRQTPRVTVFRLTGRVFDPNTRYWPIPEGAVVIDVLRTIPLAQERIELLNRAGKRSAEDFVDTLNRIAQNPGIQIFAHNYEIARSPQGKIGIQTAVTLYYGKSGGIMYTQDMTTNEFTAETCDGTHTACRKISGTPHETMWRIVP